MGQQVIELGSFRDPSGHIFFEDGVLYRQVNHSYSADFRTLVDSGLYKSLVDRGLLVSHEEIGPRNSNAYTVIRPEQLPFISYPHEWSFHQLKDAALLTLQIHKEALGFGMSLKDASAYNIQFHNGKPVLIDTLSFKRYQEGEAWIAYRQFCQHFLAPLALMSSVDVRLGKLLNTFIDGIPLDLASNLLPWTSKLKFGQYVHIYFHSRMQRKFGDRPEKVKETKVNISRTAHEALIDSLRSNVEKLEWRPGGTEWADYYEATNYTDAAMRHKEETVREWSRLVNPKTAWDLGANTGRFSKILAEVASVVVAGDVDVSAVDRNYIELKKEKGTKILPLITDLTNPTSGFGWASTERKGLTQRGPADLVVALALIHHLVISNNVPLSMVAKFLRECSKNLIIEFVPKSDSQVRKLLATREDIFPDYNETGFEKAFSEYFTVEKQASVSESDRTIYLMRAR